MLRAGLAVCLFLAAPVTSAALNPRTLISQYTSDHWRTRDGLPQAAVSAIAQTADGYIWLATEEGLVRFDGVRFTVFDSTNSALTDNYISGLLGGRDGSLWVRTSDRLYRYRGGTLQSVCSGSSIGLDATPILANRSGAIWSADVGGVMVYGPNGSCSHHALDADASGAIVNALVERSDGIILIGTSRGLKQFRGGAIAGAPGPGVSATLVSALLIDRGGALWIANPGVLFRRSGTGTKRFAAADGMPTAEIKVLLQDKDGSIWFGTDGHGLGRIQGDQVETLSTANGFPGNRMRALYGIGKAVSGSGQPRPARFDCATARRRHSAGTGACQGTWYERSSRMGPAASSLVSMAPGWPCARRTAPSRPLPRSTGCAPPASARSTTTAPAAC